MRYIFAALLCGCGDSPQVVADLATATDLASTDQAQATQDLTGTNVDLAGVTDLAQTPLADLASTDLAHAQSDLTLSSTDLACVRAGSYCTSTMQCCSGTTCDLNRNVGQTACCTPMGGVCIPGNNDCCYPAFGQPGLCAFNGTTNVCQ